MSEESFKVEKLNGENYHSWKFNLKMYLMGKDLWDIVQEVEVLTERSTPQQRELFRKRDNRAMSIINLSITNDLQIYVRSAKSATEAWNNLADHFEEKTLSKIIYYRRKLYKMSMGKGMTMESYVNSLKTVSEHLEALNDPVSEKDLVMILISSLPEDYNNLVTALETLQIEQLTWNYVRDRVMSEYLRKKGDDVSSRKTSQDALYTHQHNNGGGRRNPQHHQQQQHQQQHQQQNNRDGKQNNQFTRRDQGKGSSNNKKLTMRCHHCNEKGHLARDCPKKLGVPKPSGSASFSVALSTSTVNLNPTCSPALALKTGGDGSGGDDWFVDSGASQHMDMDEDDFENYQEFETPLQVKIADDSFLLAPGCGDVRVPLYDVASPRPRQFDVLLQNTLYVPELANKLFSISSATEQGGSVKLEKTKCILEKDGMELEIGSKHGRLYKLNTVARQPACNLAAGNPLSTWHLRYGHLNCNDVKLLFNQKLVTGMKLSSTDHVEGCHGCAVGKSKRVPFPKKSDRKTTRPLELVHSDVCGPFHVDSVGGSRYFVTFVDDYSRYVTVFMIKSKSEAFDKFVDFVIMSENKFGVKVQDFELEGELGLKLKKFRSDGGGEYISNRFLEFCNWRGIEKQITVPYTPQQNGVAERMNRTLVEMARSMLHHANCSLDLWAEAVSTAAYLRNRCPTAAFQGATPFERWCGEKPDVEHLRIFGCHVYTHVPDEKRRKLEPKAMRGVFVGYPDGTKGYKIFIPETKKMLCSRDVQFLEKSFSSPDPRSTVEQVFDIASSDNTTSCTSPQPTTSTPLDHRIHISTEHFDTNFDTNFDTASESDDDLPDHLLEENLNLDVDLGDVLERGLPPRNRRQPQRYGEWATVANADSSDPRTFKQAMKSKQSESWKTAMQNEYKSLIDHHTWDLVDLPADANLVGCRWVFKTKYKANGEIDKYKARLVAQGYSQEPGVDYDEVYAPVAKYKSIRTLLAIGNQFDLEIHQMDVVAAFLNGDLKDNIYMKQPEGFIDSRYPNKVLNVVLTSWVHCGV